ncbi:peptide ABC transporter substrate-binding protein [Fusibacter sp. JL298sf-3]
MKKLLALLLVFVLVGTALTGCGGNEADDKEVTKVDENSDSSGEDKKDETPVAVDPEKMVMRITGGKITTLNQHVYETTAESDTMSLIYGSLLEAIYDEETENYAIIGNHAEDVPVMAEDRVTWTFKIKDGLKWTDGTPIDAETYLYSYKMLLDPKLANYRAQVFFDDMTVVGAEAYFSGEETNFENVGIKALDKNTLQLTLAYPIAEIDMKLNFAGGGVLSPVHPEIYEANFNEDRTENTYGTSFETTASCGAYELIEWTRDQYRRYKKVQESPMAAYNVPEYIDERVVEDRTARMQLFENGDTDFVSISGPDYDKYGEDPRLVFSTSTAVWSMFINMAHEDKAFLRDVNFRKAMYYGMNRDTIAYDIIKTGIPAGYIVSSAKISDPVAGTFYRDTEEAKAVMPENNGYNTELAKSYMEEVYSAHGKVTVEIAYFDSSDNLKRIAELLEQEYEELFGEDKIDVVLKAVPWQTSYENMENGNYEMAFGSWVGSRFNPWSGMNVYTANYPSKIDQHKSEEFDTLFDRTVKGDLIFKPEERLAALARMEEILFEAVPFVPMYEPQTPFLFSDRVHLITGGKYVPGAGFGIYQSELDPLE